MSARAFAAGPAGIVLAIGGLYVGQSIISGVTFTALPSVLREQGMSLDEIGLTYLAVLPWALKFLWAPAVERYRLPPTGASRSRSIVFLGGVIAALGLCLVGLIGPTALVPLLATFVVVAFAAATVDIACDGHAVESLSQRHHGWGNAAQVGGAYLGSAIGSGLFLILVARVDWSQAAFAMAVLIVVLGLPFILSPAPAARRREHRPSLGQALRRSDMRRGLVLAALFVIAQKWGLFMLGPFLVDAGLDLALLGTVNGAGGLIVGFGFALLGGALVRHWGARPVMVLGLALQSLALAGFAAAAVLGDVPKPLLVTLALGSSSAVLAVSFVALYAHFMALSDPRQAGVDFTLLQCMDAFVSMIGGVAAGWISERFGFGSFFTLAAAAAAVSAPAVLLLSGPGTGRNPDRASSDMRSGCPAG